MAGQKTWHYYVDCLWSERSIHKPYVTNPHSLWMQALELGRFLHDSQSMLDTLSGAPCRCSALTRDRVQPCICPESLQKGILVSKLGLNKLTNTALSLSAESAYILYEVDTTGQAHGVLRGGTDSFPAQNMLYQRRLTRWACLHLLPNTAKPPNYVQISSKHAFTPRDCKRASW